VLINNFRGMTPVRALDALPRDATHAGPAQSPGMASLRRALGEQFPAIPGPSATRASGGVPLCFSATFEISREDRIWSAPNNGRERDSLMRAETSLIANLNSLQGLKKFPVRMRRELARRALI
jgi:hypothetical protein